MRATSSRRSRLSSRPFYTTVLLLALFTAYSFLAQTQRRAAIVHDGRSLLKRKELTPTCHDVHAASDQCAFVKEYCADDEAGLFPYLQLYYCALGKAHPVGFTILVVWLGLLFTTIGIAASDFFSINLSTIATILGLSESLAGVTFLAFGNGSPDVFSTFAAMSSNSASMAVGELIGAASFITGVVAGSMALVREFRVDRKTYARDICFFIVAVAFTMVFLADGELRFWECCVMIGYYAVYVITVVTWHWYSTRRKRRLRREGEARSHFYALAANDGDELAGEPYQDESEVDRASYRQSPNLAPESALSSLENGPRIEVERQVTDSRPDSDSDETMEDHERMVVAEVTRNMRVMRPQGRRRNTITPIRPSLVGALEFRSALAQLQRESNLQLSHIPIRSYSENHAGARERRGSTSVIPDLSHSEQHIISASENAINQRERAMSYGHLPGVSLAPSDLLDVGHDDTASSHLAPSDTGTGQRTPSPRSSYVIGGRLAPPPSGQASASHDGLVSGVHSETISPRLQLQIPSRRSSYSEGSSNNSPFLQYTDSPMVITPNPVSENGASLLPPPAAAPAPAAPRRESSFPSLHHSEDTTKPVKWWPHSLLPPPHVLSATLFPTLQGWREKPIWDKIVSTISIPSIFLLVTTLPVVESETTDETSLDDGFSGIASHQALGHMAVPISVQPGEIEPEDEWERYRRYSRSSRSSHQSGVIAHPPLLSFEHEDTLVVPPTGAEPIARKPLSEINSATGASEEKVQWNRWLVCLQMFTGPLFVVVILWANMKDDWENPGKVLARMVLWTLLGSFILLGALLFSTSEQKRPKYHFLFCFLGFIISIAWISTVAGEVVGVLKTFGVVLGISEALLGLTIFAAGNSVGDLVADITVARLGYPVMALSACFGGPMLNILLGIGIGGVLMMVQDANHHQHKHPDRKYRYEPYQIQIGGTLMISSITLLVILVGLLILVPMNKWVLSRKIGWVLIAVWTASTLANVVVDVTGAIGDVS